MCSASRVAALVFPLILMTGPSTTKTAAAPPHREYHVAPRGNDANEGMASRPLRTISAAAALAQPGDVITVHEGVYRERINPPRGGTSHAQRIVYQAAPGEHVVIKGSEVVKGWQRVAHDTWKVSLPHRFFGAFNPYRDAIRGDWFNAKGRVHHTGAIYLNGHWLTESASLEEVLKPAGKNPMWFTPAVSAGSLLNVAWLALGDGSDRARRVPADDFASQRGVQTAASSEGGQCIGWIEAGDWLRYDNVDFGKGTDTVAIRAASPGAGGRIELRIGQPDGELLGTAVVTKTGDWQKWATFTANIKSIAGKQTVCMVFRAHALDDNATTTTIWAQLPGVTPNEEGIEINVRQSVFYPERAGVNYLTVRGFTLEQAATPWAPPTAEQIGLIGTHWSKGWIIENNTIRYSACTGITLGKYGDQWDNRSQSADAYNRTIERALQKGWSRDNIGHHIVRNNTIAHCEQAGIVGSLGAAFSSVRDNHIHDIHVRQLFSGAEMAGIKFHGAIDTEIVGNQIHRATRGIWLDWMTQGTRVTGNLLHDNGPGEDLFVEVNHGPFLVDNNILLSPNGVLVNSQGGAYVHNLVAGDFRIHHNERRQTPFHAPHSTKVAGLSANPSGDDRYYYNLFVGSPALTVYDSAKLPVFMDGNVFVKGARASRHEQTPLVAAEFDPSLKLVENADGVHLEITLDETWTTNKARTMVTTELLGAAKIPDLPYENPDGSPVRIDTDYFGTQRGRTNVFPGPFELPGGGRKVLKIWPRSAQP